MAPIGVVVDTLIGYLEKSTAYLRAIANQVFGLLTSSIDKDTVDLILSVSDLSCHIDEPDFEEWQQLERRDPAHREDDEDEVDDVINDLEDGAESTEASSSAGHDSEDSEDVEDDPELRRKIEEALRINGIQAVKHDEASESDAASSNEELMDDDQMMQLDEHLAEIFRSRAKTRSHGGL